LTTTSERLTSIVDRSGFIRPYDFSIFPYDFARPKRTVREFPYELSGPPYYFPGSGSLMTTSSYEF